MINVARQILQFLLESTEEEAEKGESIRALCAQHEADRHTLVEREDGP